jgi:ELWxxDGT repeat protein
MKRVLLFLLFSNTLLAQPTYHFDLFKDINSNTNDARILFIDNIGNTAIFFHIDRNINTGVFTLRLWKSTNGMMENFASSNLFGEYTYYYKPTIIDNYIFFNVGNHGFQNGLYVANLNSSVIKQVAEINDGARVVKCNNKFYYASNSQHEDGRLYYYNEITNESTEIQGANLNFFNPTSLKVVNDKLYFAALTGNPPPYIRELWVSDGTNAGTHRVIGGPQHSLGYGTLGKIGNKVIYSAYDDTYINRLYISDGTEAGTYPFKDGGGTVYFYEVGDKAFMLSRNGSTSDIWITDGTEANTKFVAQCEGIGLFGTNEIASKDGYIFFTNGSGQLYKTDGNTIKLLKDSGFSANYVHDFKMVYNPDDGNLYFSHRYNFYKTDGTTEGTQLISNKQEAPVYVDDHIPFGMASDKILAYTKPQNDFHLGFEIYEVNADTVKIVKDLDSTTRSADLQFLFNKQGKTYFTGTDGQDIYAQAFETDGTLEGTRRAVIGHRSADSRFVAVNNELYLIRDLELQKIDFSTGSYYTIKALPLSMSFFIPDPVQINNKFYFALGGSYDINELWVSDGTEAGTKKIRTFSYSENFQSYAVYNQQLYVFTKIASTNTINIWKYTDDNTPPVLLKTFESSGVSTSFATFNNKLPFLAEVPTGRELWFTDGTTNGTIRTNYFELNASLYPNNLYFADSFYYYSTYSDNRTRVWKSDGTPAGTTLVSDLSDTNSGVLGFCKCNNEIFFGLNKTESTPKSYLYKYTNATNTTTFLNETGSIDMGNGYSVKKFYCLDRQLYFSAAGYSYDLINLYTSDGTSAGTKAILSLENRPIFVNGIRSGTLYPLNAHEVLVLTNDKFYDIEWFTFRRCDNPTSISGITGDSKIQTSQTYIESNEKLTGESRVYYFAPKSITLKPGFSVDNSNVFKAEIKNRPCTLRQ